MSTQSRLESLKEEVRVVKNSGQSINPEALLNALQDILDQTGSERELLLAEHTYRLDHARETSLEMFRSVITTGQSALKATMLLNGGAAVAMLAFVGKLVEHDSTFSTELGQAVLWFAFGALASVMATGTTYLGQLFYAGEDGWMIRVAKSAHALTVFLVIASLAFFGAGAWATAASVSLM